MSNIYHLSKNEKIFDEASVWLAKLDRGLSEAEVQELQRWMVSDKRHHETLFSMAQYWDKMASLSCLADIFPREKPAMRLYRSYAAGVAVLVAGVIFALLLIQPDYSAKLSKTIVGAGVYEAAVGQSLLVDLPDGSQALLNTDTLLRTRYSDNWRYIVLERGEAHFTVAKDAARPFVVHAADNIIQAVGTAFNVKLKKNNIIALTVTEGVVAVADNPGPFTLKGRVDGTPLVVAEKAVNVGKGEAAILNAKQVSVEKIPEEKLLAELSWRDGNIIFEGETLENAIDEISRYTTVKLEITDNRIRDIKVAGIFKSGDINGLLMTLNENFDISAFKLNDQHIQLTLNENAIENPATGL